jgi:hypothetical protein
MPATSQIAGYGDVAFSIDISAMCSLNLVARGFGDEGRTGEIAAGGSSVDGIDNAAIKRDIHPNRTAGAGDVGTAIKKAPSAKSVAAAARIESMSRGGTSG